MISGVKLYWIRMFFPINLDFRVCFFKLAVSFLKWYSILIFPSKLFYWQSLLKWPLTFVCVCDYILVIFHERWNYSCNVVFNFSNRVNILQGFLKWNFQRKTCRKGSLFFDRTSVSLWLDTAEESLSTSFHKVFFTH